MAIVVHVCMALLLLAPLVLKLLRRDEETLLIVDDDKVQRESKESPKREGPSMTTDERLREENVRRRIHRGPVRPSRARAGDDRGVAQDLLVVNSTKGDACIDPTFAGAPEVHDVELRLKRSGLACELTQPVGVDPVDELLKAMDRPDAGLLVIGIRHRNPVGKLLLGSVSQQLLLECQKPVLAVKPAA